MEVEVTYIQDGFLTNDVLQEMVSGGGGQNPHPPQEGHVPILLLAPVTVTVPSWCFRAWGQHRCLQPPLSYPRQTLLVEFYKGAPDLVKFQELWSQDQTYLDKLKVRRGRQLQRPPSQF